MWLPSHYLSIPLGLFVVCVLSLLSRRVPHELLMRLQRALLLLLLLSELIKHAEGLYLGTYSPTYYPFHYSATYYISIALYNAKREYVRHYGACTLLVGGALLLFTLLVNPYAVVGDTADLTASYFHFHGYFYHMAVLLFFGVMLSNAAYRVQPFDALRYLSFLLAWGILALPAAHLTVTNYAGLLSSFIPSLEQLRLAAGDGAYLAIYGIAVFVIACVLLQLYARLIDRQKSADTQKAQP